MNKYIKNKCILYISLDVGIKTWTKELDSLDPVIIEKVFEIAESLMITGKYIEGESLEQAIKSAKEWYYDLLEEWCFI